MDRVSIRRHLRDVDFVRLCEDEQRHHLESCLEMALTTASQEGAGLNDWQKQNLATAMVMIKGGLLNFARTSIDIAMADDCELSLAPLCGEHPKYIDSLDLQKMRSILGALKRSFANTAPVTYH